MRRLSFPITALWRAIAERIQAKRPDVVSPRERRARQNEDVRAVADRLIREHRPALDWLAER